MTGRLYAVPSQPESTLAQAWAANVEQARTSLAAVARGELRASARQRATWQRIIANDDLRSRS